MKLKPVRWLLALAALAITAAQPATARDNPCVSLASIVSNFRNTSSNHGKTANQLFAELGELSVMARLGQAAAHVQVHEPIGTAINVVSPNGDTAYAELSSKIRWLNAVDLQPFATVPLAPANRVSDFCTTGMLGGIYVHENAGLLLGRMTDALLIAFRATNDGWALTDAPVTPDAYDWTHIDHHYSQYSDIIPAIERYLTAHPEIKKVYLAGDSLGGAMTQRFLQLHPGAGNMRGVTFGSPGTPSIAFEDARLWTFINDIDPLFLVPNLIYKVSGKRFIVHLGLAPSVPPNATYHAPQAYYRLMRHFEAHGLSKSYLATRFAGAITRWNSLQLRLRKTTFTPEDFTVGVPGTLRSLPGSNPRVMAGGDGTDRLIGGIGAGDLFGFGGADCLESLHRPERLFGGAGPDVFLLHGNYSGFGGDVMDFRSGSDRLALLSTVPAFTPLVDGRNFIRGTTPNGVRPTLLYDRSAGQMWFDMDGTGVIPVVLVARLKGSPTVEATDIALTPPAICK
jgi:pimeloyl-ACP methyl ester carboxylesterase